MKNLNEINKILRDHERRISVLEDSTGKTKKPQVKGKKQSLSVHIIELRDSGFFSQQKTAEETHAKLSTKYPCKLNRVEVALVRLSRKRELRKASKVIHEKEYQAYVW